MGMSVQKKFICGFTSFVLFIGLVGFIIGFFARPSKKCGGTKKWNDDTARMLTLQKEALELVEVQKIRDNQKHFINESWDNAETNESCKHAQYIKKEWNSLGLNTVEVKHYEVLLSYPKRPSKLSLVDQTGQLVYSSVVVQSDIHALGGVPFSAYSTSGVAMGKLLYVNYGTQNDFKYLDDRNISCTAKLVLLRYGKILESVKIANAQKWNSAGVLLYLDPADSGRNATNSTSTKVTWYASGTGEWMNKGDPLTPGYPATAGIFRESVNNIPLAKFPIQPISSGEAKKLLRLLNHTLVPAHWQGGLDFEYGIQMDPNDTRNVSLNVSIALVKRSVCSVVGTIRGEKEPDRYVLLGSLRPFGGTAVLMEIARILLSIKKKGWLPRRTIKICSWGAGNTGAVEWIEEYERVLETRAVAFLNVDSSAQDLNMGVKVHQLLKETAFKAAKLVKVAGSSTESLYDEWIKTGSLPINMESGCFPFAYKIGVPCVSLVYYPYNASSSINTPGNFNTNMALVQVWLQMTFDIAGSKSIPFHVVQYAKALRMLTEELSANYIGTLTRNNITLEFLIKAAEEFQEAAQVFQDCLYAVDKDNVLQVRMFNDRLMQLERAFISKELFPGRPSARHVVLASSYFSTSYGIQSAGITESIRIAQDTNRETEWQKVRKQISMATNAFRSAVSVLRPPDF